MMTTGKNQNNRKKAKDCETFFAPAEHAGQDVLKKNVELLTSNPIADTLLHTVSGLMAILNEQRQVLALNASLMKSLGIDDAEEVLGLRPGEAIHCIHAHDQPGGCGTSRYCVTCGAVIAIVAALATDSAQERTCVATVNKNGKNTDLFFRVRCTPVVFDEKRFLLLFLQDCTIQQQQAALEYVFFHDIQNMIAGLKLSSHLLDTQQDPVKRQEVIACIAKVTRQLDREIEIQRALTSKESDTFSLLMEEVDVGCVVNELRTMLSKYVVSLEKTFSILEPIPQITITSDAALLKRILVNMVINAFEATEPGGAIRFWVKQTDKDVSFYVWNRQAIPPEQQLRIFQRNYSTKSDSGRGLGTYSMKLFGETYLGGQVDFTSTEEEGTTFHLRLPKGN
ncbi:MAG: HAMP domain-containing histidine kinase [Sedimentisphaerales bacterium]|nr:HAMP domain-containing histidine kinase [Sedimentisphaerales bacterium]